MVCLAQTDRISKDYYLPYSRQRIVFLSQEGKSISQIMELLSKERILTTKKTVSHWIFRWSSQSSLVDIPRVGRPSKITADNLLKNH